MIGLDLPIRCIWGAEFACNPTAMVCAAGLQRVVSWGRRCQLKVGHSFLGVYCWFGCWRYLLLVSGSSRRLLLMVGLRARAFFLHSVNFCLHGCYFVLGLGQLVCSVQDVLLGEDLFLLFQSLKLEVQNGELILVRPRRI